MAVANFGFRVSANKAKVEPVIFVAIPSDSRTSSNYIAVKASEGRRNNGVDRKACLLIRIVTVTL